MSLNDSFIQEVSDEVRRDRLFGLFRRYGWVAACLILLLVGGAGINEWRKSQARATAELNGDKLREVLQGFSNSEKTEPYMSYLNQNLPGKSLAAQNPTFLMSEGSNNVEKMEHLKDVANDLELPIVLRDLALLYSFYISHSNFDGKMETLNILSGPDRPYRLLAIEAKIDLLLSRGFFDEALIEVKLIESDILASSGMISRIKNLKTILQDQIDSD